MRIHDQPLVLLQKRRIQLLPFPYQVCIVQAYVPRKEVVPLSLEVIIIIRVNVIELFIKVFHPMLPFRNIVIQKLIIYENRESTRNISVTSN